MSDGERKHWLHFVVQRNFYRMRGHPYPATYDEWEPLYLERRRRGIVIHHQTEWQRVEWEMTDDEERFNDGKGGRPARPGNRPAPTDVPRESSAPVRGRLREVDPRAELLLREARLRDFP